MESLDSPLYYRVIRSDEGKPRVVCLQWFDEFHYEQERFMTKDTFDTQEEAWIWIDKYNRDLANGIFD
jgi:hypothetical protein